MDLERFVLFLLVTSCRLSIGSSPMLTVTTGKFVLVVQGRYQCPDPLYVESYAVAPARSQLDCARQCILLEDCLYHGFNRNEKICNLYTLTPDRFLPTPGCTLMVIPAAFQDSLTTGCIIAQKVVNVTMGPSVVPLPCINNWIIMMNRCDGSVNFNRPWADYKLGFGDIGTSEFWIGNENIHLYTSQIGTSYSLRIEVETTMTGKWFYAEYTTFFLDSESNMYAISLSGYVGNAGDSLTDTTSMNPNFYFNGMDFSTTDVDNDRQSGFSCAVFYKTGWWYNRCMNACLTCLYSSPNFVWNSLIYVANEPNALLQAARMMIRSNNP